MMDLDQYDDVFGPFDARYRAFLETISTLRPSLHRYCARMTGSVMDGEDVVQESLFEAYRKLDQFDDSRPLKPWLFRIAHNRCIDFLRKRGVRVEAEMAAASSDIVVLAEPAVLGVGRALEHLVIKLPPKERACVLLKDVFDYTLEEIAELVDSTVGGVKAALHRGRSKIKASPEPIKMEAAENPEFVQLLDLYVERFNRHDWDGLRELISADARLRVADVFAGRLDESGYFGVYERWPFPWKMAVGEVDGESVVIMLRRGVDAWAPHSVVRFDVVNQRVERITDYFHCPWVLEAATSTIVATSQ
jgi:RNA polymerase sigma-70 factor (ECF subfamily)